MNFGPAKAYWVARSQIFGITPAQPPGTARADLDAGESAVLMRTRNTGVSESERFAPLLVPVSLADSLQRALRQTRGPVSIEPTVSSSFHFDIQVV